MNQDNVTQFLTMLSNIRPFVPPILFDTLGSNECAKALLMISQGLVTCKLEPTEPIES